MNSIFLDKNKKLKLLPTFLSFIFFLFFISMLILIFKGDSKTEKGVFQINQDIPEQNQNIRLEKDREVTYLERREVEVIIKTLLNQELTKIQEQLDQEQRDVLAGLDTYKDKLEKTIAANLPANLQLENNYRLLKEKVDGLLVTIGDLRQENRTLKTSLYELENKIALLQQSGSVPLSSLDLPVNNYNSSSGNNGINVPKAPLFTFEGIVKGTNTVAIVKDQEGKSSYLKTGDSFKGYLVKKILDNSLVFDFKGKEISVALYEGVY